MVVKEKYRKFDKTQKNHFIFAILAFFEGKTSKTEYKNGSKFLNFVNFTYGYHTFVLEMRIFFVSGLREWLLCETYKKNKKKNGN